MIKSLISFKNRLEYFFMPVKVTVFAQMIITSWTIEKITHFYYIFVLTFITFCFCIIIIRVFCAKFKGMSFSTLCYLNFFSILIKNILNLFIFVIIFFFFSWSMDTLDPKTFSFLMIVKYILRIGYCIELSLIFQYSGIISSIFIFIHELFVFFIFFIFCCLCILLYFH